MARTEPTSPKQPRRKMTQDEIDADAKRRMKDPKMLEILRQGLEDEARGIGTRWEDLKREHGRR